MNLRARMSGVAFAFLAVVTLACCNDGGVDDDSDPGVACTEIGCSDGLSLQIDAANSTFAEGTYEVFFTGEAQAFCTFRVSNDNAECASGHCVAAEECNALYSLGQDSGDSISIQLGVLEGAFGIEIRLDDTVVADETLDPQYETLSPNGPDCAPTCTQASATVTVP